MSIDIDYEYTTQPRRIVTHIFSIWIGRSLFHARLVENEFPEENSPVSIVVWDLDSLDLDTMEAFQRSGMTREQFIDKLQSRVRR